MYVLITYDVATATEGGARRLRHAAKLCLDYGQRVQYSVFECEVDPAQFTRLKARLLDLLDLEQDSVRFYHLGANWHRRVEHFGAKKSYDIDGFLGV